GHVPLRGGVMAGDVVRVQLHRLAHGRAGDKGDTLNVSVIAYRPEVFPLLVEQVTEARVAGVFRDRAPTAVRRYVLPKLVALNLVPTAAALVGGFGLDTTKFIVKGIRDVAPVAGMFVFAILYFGVVTDAGLLDPVIDRVLRAVGGRPRRIVVGTALLALM